MIEENKKASIMIVDDTPENLRLLAEMLRTQDYRVLQFPNGSMAIKAAEKNPPDLILLDIRMPEMDGFEVCKRLKMNENLKDIPIIFISILDDLSDKINAFLNGGVDYVTKPFNEDEVIARVGVQIKIVMLQRELKLQNNRLEEQVSERTKELAFAHKSLKGLDRLKDDFLHMISHEIRTPINGILGIGDLMLKLCPDSEEKNIYEELFKKSTMRLKKLIEDADLIAEVDLCENRPENQLSLKMLIEEVKGNFPKEKLSYCVKILPEKVCIRLNPVLLKRATETLLLLGHFFSTPTEEINIEVSLREYFLVLKIPLNNLMMTQVQAENFFNIESTCRSSSSAQEMGLAPVVAKRIFCSFGGDLKIEKSDDNSGFLEALIPVNTIS